MPEGVRVTTARRRHRAGFWPGAGHNSWQTRQTAARGLWPGAGHNSCGRRGRRQQEASGLVRGGPPTRLRSGGPGGFGPDVWRHRIDTNSDYGDHTLVSLSFVTDKHGRCLPPLFRALSPPETAAQGRHSVDTLRHGTDHGQRRGRAATRMGGGQRGDCEGGARPGHGAAHVTCVMCRGPKPAGEGRGRGRESGMPPQPTSLPVWCVAASGPSRGSGAAAARPGADPRWSGGAGGGPRRRGRVSRRGRGRRRPSSWPS